MLRTKLFQGFAVLVILFSILAAYVGVQTSQRRMVEEAQTRVQLNLGGAWSVLHGKMSEIETVLRLVAGKQLVQELAEVDRFDEAEVRLRLERIRINFGLDFLQLLSPEGEVLLRTTSPYNKGDFRLSDPTVSRAIKGEIQSALTILSPKELATEGAELAERSFIPFEDTPRARPSPRTVEDRGLAMISAVPVVKGAQVIGVVYGGVLLNRNLKLVDQMHDIVFKNEVYQGVPVGTATIFLGDCRIATTVRLRNGNRAMGTRVSQEVADWVLDNGRSWAGEAFVVKDRYLAAYDPIRNVTGDIIGMLYVGTLKKPFEDYSRGIALRYGYVSLFALLVGLVLAFFIASRLANPIHRLMEAADRVTQGHPTPPVVDTGSCDEVRHLIHAFNQMTSTLAEREVKLKALNRSYMETLGFVSHELKGPVATILNYAYLLREQKLGEVNDRQVKAIRAIDAASNRLVEMVRHYLNLSRIENGELQPLCGRIVLREDILTPLLDRLEHELQAHAMRVDLQVGPEIVLLADRNMVLEVFENLFSNAMKYGRPQGVISLHVELEEPDRYLFKLRNDGEGIPADRIDSLFQKFTRLEGTEGVRCQKGTGLGLFITRSIVEAHGGRIRVASEAGAWVEFVFTLPRFKQEGEAHV
jgi:two-component system NtrC family sensor kinase